MGWVGSGQVRKLVEGPFGDHQARSGSVLILGNGCHPEWPTTRLLATKEPTSQTGILRLFWSCQIFCLI